MTTYQNNNGRDAIAVRGASRALNSALRSAGIGADSGSDRMDLDGGVGRAGRGRKRTPRSGDPLDQSGRRSRDTPYSKPGGSGKPLSSRITGLNGPPAGASKKAKRRPNDPRRAPEGTPEILRDNNPRRTRAVQQQQHSKMNEILRGDAIKEWLRSRLIAPGVLNMANLPDDPWLTEQGVLPPGHKDAPLNAGHVFWRLIANVLETPDNRIHTLSLANNNFSSLAQLQRLPVSLPYIRALDLSDNPIHAIDELKHLQSQGEAQGKASSASGSLKSLIELKLNGTRFREEMLKKPNGGETYQHDILRRFSGLLILDGVQLNRIVFPIERKPTVRRSAEERKPLSARPFTYPMDIVPSFEENDACKAAVMEFCQKFFVLYDVNRAEVVHAYHPEATVSVSCNTLPSRSFQAADVIATRQRRPPPANFEAWTNLPGRNFFRPGCATIQQRTHSLKSPMDMVEFLTWLANKVPGTKHPIDDASKWSIDAWYFDDNNERICAVIQGEFEEKPSGTFRSFTRTFILGAPDASASAKGWPCMILSDIMVVHSYLGTGSWDSKRTLFKGDITLAPPTIAAIGAPAAGEPTDPTQRAALVEAVHQRTGMNNSFSEMCLAQNGWDLERAVANFAEIRASIPPEAFN